jgi:hypothetical protein
VTEHEVDEHREGGAIIAGELECTRPQEVGLVAKWIDAHERVCRGERDRNVRARERAAGLGFVGVGGVWIDVERALEGVVGWFVAPEPARYGRERGQGLRAVFVELARLCVGIQGALELTVALGERSSCVGFVGTRLDVAPHEELSVEGALHARAEAAESAEREQTREARRGRRSETASSCSGLRSSRRPVTRGR